MKTQSQSDSQRQRNIGKASLDIKNLDRRLDAGCMSNGALQFVSRLRVVIKGVLCCRR